MPTASERRAQPPEEPPCETLGDEDELMACIESREYDMCEPTEGAPRVPGLRFYTCEEDGGENGAYAELFVLAVERGVARVIANAGGRESDAYEQESLLRVLDVSRSARGDGTLLQITVASVVTTTVPDDEPGEDGDSDGMLHERGYREYLTLCLDHAGVTCPVAGLRVREHDEVGRAPWPLDLAAARRRAPVRARVSVAGNALSIARGREREHVPLPTPTFAETTADALLDAAARGALRDFAQGRGGETREAPYEDTVARLRLGRTNVLLVVPREGRATLEPVSVTREDASAFGAGLTRSLARAALTRETVGVSHLNVRVTFPLFSRPASGFVLVRPGNADLFPGRPSTEELDAILSPTAL